MIKYIKIRLQKIVTTRDTKVIHCPLTRTAYEPPFFPAQMTATIPVQQRQQNMVPMKMYADTVSQNANQYSVGSQ